MFRGPISKYRVIVAPNSMKGTLDTFSFAGIVKQAFHDVSSCFDVVCVPVADGGDFTGEVLLDVLNLQRREVRVHDPLGRLIKAGYGIKESLAVIGMADASGMKLLSAAELDPMKTSSLGTGELLEYAINKGAHEILIGVGGSATVDGGMGLLAGLGMTFYDKDGKKLTACGGAAGKIASWDDSALDPFKRVKIRVICDVLNPLSGKHGAVYVFAGQKGATPEMLPVLEQNLAHFAGLVEKKTGRSLSGVPGMGAAGGVNLALAGFLNAEIVPGADFILDYTGFGRLLGNASLVITGEGKIDGQTACNKAPFAVFRRAREKGIPVFAIGGQVTEEGARIFDRTYALAVDETGIKDAFSRTRELVYERAVLAAKDFLSGYGSM